MKGHRAVNDKSIMEPYVISELTPDGIATVTFFHPAQNAMPGFLLRQLAETIEETGRNPTVKVMILQSGGERTFCAGASFDELASIQDEEEGKAFFSGFANVINACRKSPLIILGRVQGKAVGGGVGLAAATDYCFATRHAAIRLSELMIGIGPFVVGPAIERKIGLSAFSQLALNASTFYDASWAKEKGLYAEVFETAAEMDAAVSHFAKSLTQYAPAALQQLKKVFWEGNEHWESLLSERAAMSGSLVLSDFTRSAITQIRASKS